MTKTAKTVMLNYERLAEMDRRIKALEEKKGELHGKANTDPSFVPVMQKIVDEQKALRRERGKLRYAMRQRNEPTEDPRELVKRKFAGAEKYNRRLALIPKIAKKIQELELILAEYHNLQMAVECMPTDDTGRVYVQVLQNMKLNLLTVLKHTRPKTKKDYDAEMKAAQALYDRLVEEAERREEIERALEA